MSSVELLNKNEKRFLAGSLLAMLLLLLLLVSNSGIWQGSAWFSTRPAIGEIVYQSRDARHRSRDALIWNPASLHEGIHLGDAIFAGENSEAQVRLNSGGNVNIGANSLVVFNEIDHEKVADLMDGNFRLSVNGRMRVSIGGQLTTIEGTGSELQVLIKHGGRPRFRILRGEAKVDLPGKTLRLDAWNMAGMNEDDLPLKKEEVHGAAPVGQVVGEMKPYIWRLHDLYVQKDFQLFDKVDKTLIIARDVTLKWSPYTNREAKILFANEENFQFPTLFSAGRENRKTLKSVYAGDNYWKVSMDGGHQWSVPVKFTVPVEFLSDAEPRFQRVQQEVQLRGVEAVREIRLQSSVPAMGFVAQASLSSNFEPEVTRSFWTADPRLRLSFFHSGIYYYRFRTVARNQELSTWSETLRFDVKVPETPPPAPLVLTPHLASQKPAPPPSAPPQKRRVAEVESANTMRYVPDAIQTELNQKYRDSLISLQGFLWTLQSSQQYYQNSEAPVATGIGVHALHWWDHSGLEGSLKAGVLAVNKSAQPTSLKEAEARYHYRFYTPFPLGLSRELQISLFGGYEMYRNSGSLYSRQYDLIKFGTSLEFPVSRRWSSGGELAYGAGLEGSNKQEVSGHVNYFLTRDWSLGVGYRIHLFQAGSAQASADGQLPYREGYTEGYSILDYHF